MTQLFSGCDYFSKYLFRMGETTRSNCVYDEASINDAEHTFFLHFCDVILSSEKRPCWRNSVWMREVERRLDSFSKIVAQSGRECGYEEAKWPKWIHFEVILHSLRSGHTRGIVTTSPMVRLGTFTPPQQNKKKLVNVIKYYSILLQYFF